MNIIKSMRWGNIFSYGDNNYISFIDNPITQLVGANGNGKSSIPLILEECLYNKNSKGIKKADILNRYTKSKKYWIEVAFEVNNDQYLVYTERSTTAQSVRLEKNGQDISSNTSTNTYKQIEAILGIDSKTFAQLIYQSNSSSLEFLTATDSVRKNFLVNLFDLSIYLDYGTLFKDKAASAAKVVAKLETTVDVKTSQYDVLSLKPTHYQTEVDVPFDDTEELQQTLYDLTTQLKNIDSTNEKIKVNNGIKKKLDTIVHVEKPADIPSRPKIPTKELVQKQTELLTHIKTQNTLIGKFEKLTGVCPTCMSEINSVTVDTLIHDVKVVIDEYTAKLDLVTQELHKAEQTNLEISRESDTYTTALAEYDNYQRKLQSLSGYDISLPSQLLDKHSLEQSIIDLKAKIAAKVAARDSAIKHNAKVIEHNKHIDELLSEMVTLKAEIAEISKELSEERARSVRLLVLAKAFSVSGLVAYKIESLVKILEDITNEFLVNLSNGRFTISFKITGTDKLSVIITDNSKDVDIFSLSSGERARVNVATLLAIRKLMQTINGNKINLLILDETIEALDTDGKECLIDVLLEQEFLNTFIISHGFSHPLLEKINIAKVDNISKIEVI